MTSRSISSTSDQCAVQEFPAQSGISGQVKSAVGALLDLSPSDPISFLSEYFFHASHGSAAILHAYKLVTCLDYTSPTICARFGAAYELLLIPGWGLPSKECLAFLAFFCCGFEKIRSSLATISAAHIGKDRMVTYKDFTQLVIYHVLIEDLLLKVKGKYSINSSQKRIEKSYIYEMIAAVFQIEGHDILLGIRMKLYSTLTQPIHPSDHSTHSSAISFEEFLEEVSMRLVLL
ncbi:hypothetical protein BASA50_009646 [Batrachochytrium salamandrivorans]|uniref:Uncharacterized protein n=1 Tax=Batrachochytrium salamandrivorans TaxID=1357716 RepID=A0ABQ8F1L0_9FUNG|nr:hypothetical protein BASA50_009646 [Batrachochytrium salamandrivorans]